MPENLGWTKKSTFIKFYDYPSRPEMKKCLVKKVYILAKDVNTEKNIKKILIKKGKDLLCI